MDHKYNRRGRRKYSLKAHIVIVTKYRKKLLTGGIADDAKQKVYDIANARGYKIIAMETDKDHLHVLLGYDTAERVCDIVKIIKRETTHYLWARFRARRYASTSKVRDNGNGLRCSSHHPKGSGFPQTRHEVIYL